MEGVGMLVLSRKVGQELIIGDNIRITVNRVCGSRVTLGITAPGDVRVVRGELDRVVQSADNEGTAPVEKPADAEAADEAESVPCPVAWHPDGASALTGADLKS
jgi:carbon storage regulator